MRGDKRMCRAGRFVATWPRHCPPTLLIEMCWGAVLWPEAAFSLGLETNVGRSGLGIRGLDLGLFSQRDLFSHNLFTEKHWFRLFGSSGYLLGDLLDYGVLGRVCEMWRGGLHMLNRMFW